MQEHRRNPYILALGFFVITLLFGLGMAYIARLPNQQAIQGQWVNHTQEVINQLDRLALDITEAETGQRGYLLTAQDDYLLPYNAALRQIAGDLEHFQQLTADNESQQKRMPALRASISNKLDELKETIDLRKTQGQDAALQIVMTGRGKEEMTVIRQQIKDMKAEEENLLQIRSDKWRQGTTQTRMAVLIGGIFMYGLICAVLTVLLRISRNRKLMAISEQRSAQS